METVAASPFAGSLLFDYLAAYMYEGDAPLAERRAGALALDRELLRELLGQEELRDLIDPAALADLELALQALVPERAARTVDAAPRPAAPAGRSDRRGGGGADRGAGGRRRVAGGAAGIAARGRPPDRRRGALDRDRGCRPLPRRAREWRCRWAFRRPSWDRSRTRWTGLVARWARSHGPFLAAETGAALGRAGGASRGGPGAAAARRARSCAASSGRAGRSANGATRRSCGSCGAARWPVCAGRSSRSSRSCWPASCRPGRVSGPRRRPVAGDTARGAACSAARPPSSGWPRSSISWPACRSRPPCWSATSCRPGSRATSRACSTSWAPWARWPGWDAAAWAATTGGSSCTGRAARRCATWPRRDVEAPPGELHERLRERLRQRGASFYRELASAAGRGAGARDPRRAVGPGLGRRGHQRHLRAAAGPALATAVRRAATPAGPAAARPAGGGRALVARGGAGDPGRGPGSGSASGAAGATARLHSLAVALLDRHGVLTREAVAAEEVAGGFSAVYPVLRAMEEAGRIRRGYFVDGLGAAQFALPGAVDRLRSMRESPADRPAAPVGAPAGRGRSRESLRRRPDLAASRRVGSPAPAARRRARTSSWSTARRLCTSSAAGTRSRLFRPPTTRPRPRRPWPRCASSSKTAVSASWC